MTEYTKMLNDITKLLASIPNSKGYGRAIKAKPEMFKAVVSHQQTIGAKTIAETLYCIYHAVLPAKCPCGDDAVFNTFVKGYRKYCSLTCPSKGKDHSQTLKGVWETTNSYSNMVSNVRNTCLKKYGVDWSSKADSVKDRVKQSNQQKYGVNYPMFDETIKHQIKQTTLKNHGVEYPFQSEAIRQRAKESFVKNHGYTNDMAIARKAFSDQNNDLNPFQVNVIQSKIKSTLIDKYGVDHPMKSLVFLTKSQNTLFKNHGRNNPAHINHNDQAYALLMDMESLKKELETNSLTSISEKYKINKEVLYSYHDRYGFTILKRETKSRYEEEISSILDNLQIQYKRNYTQLCYPRHVDFFIPSHDIAIEFNGLYWHSEKSGSKMPDYHATKTKQCMDRGVQLLTIFEDEWVSKHQIIVNHIKHLCGKTNSVVGARKISISNEKYTPELKEFVDQYHIQGKLDAVSQSYVGRHDGKIVAVLLLKKVSGTTYDIARFCTDMANSYPGLFSKFLKYITTTLEITKFTTIADLRWSKGDVYLKTGFTIEKNLLPDYQYTDYITREHKFNYRKEIIKKKYNVDITGKTEKQLMFELKFDRIWDCGKIKFVKIV